EIPNKFAFVISGLFRYYYLDEKENELTKGFLPESSFITSYSALIQNRESYFTIEALEDSVILVIYYDEWKKLLENNIHWNKLLICLLEKAFCIKEAREREFLLFDAEERYRSFLNTFPGLENRIKQHFIASYLRITPVTLSRIRKKMGLLS
ncbi:MAG: Crp/Fnr family transcriptional regulator, partial [Spirochaetota bacterium]|nr:Crp/Fnr family transcriptional regulator [Spirochaetota bacterium]